MEYVRLGRSGLTISKIVLGCMSFGEPARGTHQWSFGIDESRPYFRQAVESGITCYDTANVYSLGASEEITGQLLREFAKRDEVVIATKVMGTMGPGPKGGGLSRAAILTQVDESLRRLGTDYIDLYQIHRRDPNVPVEETMEALHDVVKAGKARYIGASSMWTWQFAQMQHVADLHGWTRFVSMQNQYNLLQREEEREMLPYCLDQGIGVIPWSPLARGRLTRDPGEETTRSGTDAFSKVLYDKTADSDKGIIDAVAAVATERGVSRAQVALAWLLHQPAVTAPIVGTTKPHHLTDAVAAADLKLGADELQRLEEHYTPRPASGF
ncbi:aldo/keto reductase [Kutzneria kofuensis]|uniref:Aryl-alcohol dehydrogenase-like predicted oxidoreductase n=1 Tax=Kutzneria kofuensis TaxID=103725 RepID=A0A7W9NJU4_9PSEU|nr:aldo/keto reductase [Kutzneria kofuensis]MBB5894696.1 aryl-alcohol dehydrogenase-like predicted oxidoreductase [Kutzneria kofuensis]